MWRALSDSTGGSAGFPSSPLIVWIWVWRPCSGSRPKRYGLVFKGFDVLDESGPITVATAWLKAEGLPS
jgi:hypothetical protein